MKCTILQLSLLSGKYILLNGPTGCEEVYANYTSFFFNVSARLGDPLDDSLMESLSGHRKDQATIRSLEFLALTPHSLQEGEGLKMELMIDRTYMVKLP